jgi:integrase
MEERMMQAPKKPYPNFPLFAAKNGQWRKDVRVNGGKPRPFYFGPWATDPEGKAAVKEWLSREPAIRAGTDHIRVSSTGPALTLKDLLRRFLEQKQYEYSTGQLAAETLRDYIREANYLGTWAGAEAQVAAFTPDHFAGYRKHMEQSRSLGVDRLATSMRMVRAMFNHGGKMGWCPHPVYGIGFDPPNTDPDAKAAAKIRKGEDVADLPIWTGEQIEWLLAHSGPVMQAAILMGINCGVGPSDLARMTWLNIKGKRLSMRRGKTGIRREGYLWQRTRDALAVLRTLPHQKAALERDGEKALVFLNKSGQALVTRKEYRHPADAAKIKTVKVSASFSASFGALVARAKAAGVVAQDSPLTFYNLRHTFYTIAENTERTVAVKRCMGHTLKGEGKKYDRKPLPMSRLRFVALYVKHRVWPKPKQPKGKASSTTPRMRLAV